MTVTVFLPIHITYQMFSIAMNSKFPNLSLPICLCRNWSYVCTPQLAILLLDGLFVSIEPVEQSKRDILPINALDGLTMHYKVKSLTELLNA